MKYDVPEENGYSDEYQVFIDDVMSGIEEIVAGSPNKDHPLHEVAARYKGKFGERPESELAGSLTFGVQIAHAAELLDEEGVVDFRGDTVTYTGE